MRIWKRTWMSSTTPQQLLRRGSAESVPAHEVWLLYLHMRPPITRSLREFSTIPHAGSTHRASNMSPAIFPLLLVLGAAVVAADSVVEELEKHGLPAGLLPSSVESYSINEDGDFWVALQSPCYAKIEDQLAYYSRNITGQLKFGVISNLDKIEIKQLFVWLPVTGIYVDVPATPYIYFEVGVLTKRLALAVFETPPKCSSQDDDTGIHILDSAEFRGLRPRKALH